MRTYLPVLKDGMAVGRVLNWENDTWRAEALDADGLYSLVDWAVVGQPLAAMKVLAVAA